MANKTVFRNSRYVAPAPTDTVNNAGGVAYSLGDKEALAQLVIIKSVMSRIFSIRLDLPKHRLSPS